MAVPRPVGAQIFSKTPPVFVSGALPNDPVRNGVITIVGVFGHGSTERKDGGQEKGY